MVTTKPNASVDADPALAALIVENAVEYAIFTLGRDGRIASWSPGARRILGYTAEQAIGARFSMLFTASDLAAGIDRMEIDKALETGRAEDSRWHVRADGGRFWANGVTMRIERDGEIALLKIMRDETPSKLAEEQRVLLLNELNHRVKNTLATVQSIAEQTLRAGRVDPAVRRNLMERLIALSEAHNVLVQENWAGADLRTILEQTAEPHLHADPGRFRLDGPLVRLSPQQAVSIALVVHELTTNALKYGALASDGGTVTVSWNIAQNGEGRRFLTLLWEERGGPPVAAPSRTGFGVRLIERSFASEAVGQARLSFEPGGVRCVIDLELVVAPSDASTAGLCPPPRGAMGLSPGAS